MRVSLPANAIGNAVWRSDLMKNTAFFAPHRALRRAIADEPYTVHFSSYFKEQDRSIAPQSPTSSGRTMTFSQRPNRYVAKK
jgi:hypothetical protein